MRPRYKKTLLAIGVLLLLIAAVIGAIVLFWDRLPFQSLAERQIRTLLQEQGLEVSSLTVDSFDEQGATLSSLQLKGEHPLSIDHLETRYQWQKVLEGQVDNITLNGLTLTAYEAKEGWAVGGLEPLMRGKASATTDAAPLPPLLFDTAALHSMIPEQITITDGTIEVLARDWSVHTPLQASLTSTPAPVLDITTTLDARFGKSKADTAPLHISASLSEEHKRWNGSFSTTRLTLHDIPTTIPPLRVEGSFNLTATTLTLDGTLADTDKAHRAKLGLSIPVADPQKGTLKLHGLHFPWGNGTISTQDVTIPLSFTKPIPLTLKLERIDLAGLLNEISSGNVSATGLVSGSVPITWHPDGSITLRDGAAEALQEGSLSVSPDALPGNRPEMEAVRVALKDFHYTSLKITVSSDADKRSAITLQVEGSNPDAFNGRPVKLNVTLSGDVLPLIQQTLLPFSDVSQLLKLKDTPQ